MARKEKAGAVPVRIRFRDSGAVVTASAGAVLVLELLSVKRLLPRPELWDTRQGWTDGQMLLTVTLLNCLGLDRVEDVEQLESDVGLCQLVRRYEKRLSGWVRGGSPGGFEAVAIGRFPRRVRCTSGWRGAMTRRRGALGRKGWRTSRGLRRVWG